mmetsp:Transcript_1992/g.7499  ORF Transcript_1992/g.7499 Transcript_1992/m.7499 type:complete len:332 (-) Transcript_1992:50-1045(-)
MSTRIFRRASIFSTGLTTRPASAFFLASSAASAAFFSSRSRSRCFSSSVNSAGSPSLSLRAMRSSSSFSLTRALARAISSFSILRASRLRLSCNSSSWRLAARSSFPLRMRSCSRSRSISRSSFSFLAAMLFLSSSALIRASSFVSFFLILVFAMSSGSSTSASFSCSTIQFTACSTLSVPVWYSARTARLRLNPMPSSSARHLASTSGSIFSSSGSSSAGFESTSMGASTPSTPSSAFMSASSFFISFSESMAAAVSFVLSTNSACPVRFVWMSFSVSDRHGLPQATQVRFRTASVDSTKSEWPVASPCDWHSCTLRSCAPHTLHFRDRA